MSSLSAWRGPSAIACTMAYSTYKGTNSNCYIFITYLVQPVACLLFQCYITLHVQLPIKAENNLDFAFCCSYISGDQYREWACARAEPCGSGHAVAEEAASTYRGLDGWYHSCNQRSHHGVCSLCFTISVQG